MKWITSTAAALALFLAIDGEISDTVTDVVRQFSQKEEEEIIEEDITPKRGNRTPRGKHGCAESRSPDGDACAPAAALGWYCPHEKDGKRPSAPAEAGKLEEHGAYYLGKDEPVIYLTFDAGYENGNVEKILDVLKDEDVPAAFFILENLVSRNPDLVKRMAEEGHTVANHTAKHPDMSQKTKDEFTAELTRMEDAYRSLTGGEIAKYYRPPEGRFTTENLDWANELGYKTILWSYAYADWDNDRQMPPEAAAQKVLAGTHNGEVLLLHPTSKTNAEILRGLIRTWKQAGYRFGTLDELTEAK
ncbi:MAG: polysaccharide deacetylase family protein [Clostridia bacterium]|nr:polysaccharide deacetylase family protein [Clostridia bacterium]